VDGALNIGDESQLPWDWSIKKFAAKLFSFHRGRPLPINNLKPSWGMKSAAFASLQRSIIPGFTVLLVLAKLLIRNCVN